MFKQSDIFRLPSLRRRIITVAAAMLLLPSVASARGVGCRGCDDCEPRVALKTNLLGDAALIPSLGVEVSLAHRWSLSADGVWAWWSRHEVNRCWRVFGGRLELRRWLGRRCGERAMTGHHLGVYASAASFDFELGGPGIQSPRLTMGGGISYGYSLKLSGRLNLDFAVNLGYATGRIIKYRPECGGYVSTSDSRRHYFGPTGVEVALVWWPGSRRNHPDYPRP